MDACDLRYLRNVRLVMAAVVLAAPCTAASLVSRRWAREAREAAEAQEHKLEPSSEGAADVPGVLLEGAADTFR